MADPASLGVGQSQQQESVDPPSLFRLFPSVPLNNRQSAPLAIPSLVCTIMPVQRLQLSLLTLPRHPCKQPLPQTGCTLLYPNPSSAAVAHLLYGIVEDLSACSCCVALNAPQLHIDVINGGLAADEALKVLLHLYIANVQPLQPGKHG